MTGMMIVKIKSRIRIIVWFIILAVVCISALSIVTERRDVIATTERLASGYARALAEHSESTFSEADSTLRELLRELQKSGGLEGADQKALFQRVHRQMVDSPQLGALFIADSKGDMRLNSEEFPSRRISIADRDYFRRYLETPGLDLSFSSPAVSRLVNRQRFNIIRPLNRPGEPFQGVIGLGFEAQYFQRLFSPQTLGLRGVVILLRTDGVPLVYEPSSKDAYQLDFRNSRLFREKLPLAASGGYRVQNALTQNKPLIVAYQRLTRFPVVAVVGFNEDDVLAPWSGRALKQSSLTIGLCLVIVILMRFLFSHLDRMQAVQSTVLGQQAQLAIKAAQIDAVSDPIMQVDDEGRLVHFNQALCRLTGYSRAELAGKSLREIEPPEFVPRIRPNILKLKELGQMTFESAFLTKDGTVIPLEVHSQLMESEGRSLMLGIARDITQRRRAEARERSRLKILERIATDASLNDLLTCIVDFVEQESPGALCSVLLVDESGTRLRLGAAPSLPERYRKALDGLRLAQGNAPCTSALLLRERVAVEDLDAHPEWSDFHPAREAGIRAYCAEPVFSSNGSLLGSFAMYHLTPCLPAKEEILLIESAAHLASIAIDRVRGDESRRVLEDKLRHSQKIEAVGQLAAGVAHDFNNLLTPIIVYADMLRRGLPHEDGNQQIKMVDALSLAAQKASELTQKLLSFGRKQVLNMTLLDLNEVISSFRDIMRTTVRENISIDLRLAPGAVQVRADRGQLEQVLLNLMLNAQDAIDGNGAICVETGHLILDEEFAPQHPCAKPGHYAMLAFSDNGGGMTEETLRRACEPFFTTKEVGRGTGLGLATVYGIVKHHGGCIEVRSRLGEGTRFEIYLCVAQSSEKPTAEPAQRVVAEHKEGQGRTILLVEDNTMIREMAGDLLASFGYRVLSAEEPLAALDLAARQGDPIDLLVSDVIMPEMTGPELYEKLLESRPHLPVLFISGYTSDTVLHKESFPQEANFLAKPFTLEQFMKNVSSILRTGPAPKDEQAEQTLTVREVAPTMTRAGMSRQELKTPAYNEAKGTSL